MHRSWRRPPCGSTAWSLDRNQRTRPNATPPPRGSSTWGDAQIGRATIEYPPHSDGSYRANGVGWHARRLCDGRGFDRLPSGLVPLGSQASSLARDWHLCYAPWVVLRFPRWCIAFRRLLSCTVSNRPAEAGTPALVYSLQAIWLALRRLKPGHQRALGRPPLPSRPRVSGPFRPEDLRRACMLAEMREHPGGSAEDIATSAAVQPGSLRCSAIISARFPGWLTY
jgi:hypothetical protein